ncbi:hypothetical protein QQZ08_012019, partial [Neonectria magnoliae]
MLINAKDIRNGGHLVSDSDSLFPSLVKEIGIEQAVETVRFSEANIRRLRDLVAQLDPAEREAVEFRDVTTTTAFEDRGSLQEAANGVRQLIKALPDGDLKYKVAFKDDRWQASLTRDFSDRFTLECNTPVVSITDTTQSSDAYAYTVHTPRGTLRAKKIIHCTNGYSSHLISNLVSKLYSLRGTMSTQKLGPSFPLLGEKISWAHISKGVMFLGGESQKLSGLLTSDDSFVASDARKTLCSAALKIWKDAALVEPLEVWSGSMGFTADDAAHPTRSSTTAPKTPLVPVAIAPNFEEPIEDELNCLVMNITTPTTDTNAKLPVMVYIHGGSFLFGGANKGVFDLSTLLLTPRLATLPSCNFGLYDQQVALRWVNHYIASFGGDPDNVTIYGESAGGMSVSHQLAAKTPAPFYRAIVMSGYLNTIPIWTLSRHEKHYQAFLKYLGIDPESPSALGQWRRVPQDVVARATIPVEGIFNATGNPCHDGVFHAVKPSFDAIASPISWLKGYMVGDVLDEGMIFYESICEDDFSTVQAGLASWIGPDAADVILELYGVTLDLAKDKFVKHEHHIFAQARGLFRSGPGVAFDFEDSLNASYLQDQVEYFTHIMFEAAGN